MNSEPAVVWFTGLSGSGKSTIARALHGKLQSDGVRVEYLDGDVVRGFFPETGFTREERDAHIRRMGFLASRLEHHGVTVLAAFISPYREARTFVRDLCLNFIEVYVSTPLEVCEKRDHKGLYAKARRGQIENFTGISDPYEAPENPALEIDTSNLSTEEAVEEILEKLR
jgi:adenylylsulfate kinase